MRISPNSTTNTINSTWSRSLVHHCHLSLWVAIGLVSLTPITVFFKSGLQLHAARPTCLAKGPARQPGCPASSSGHHPRQPGCSPHHKTPNTTEAGRLVATTHPQRWWDQQEIHSHQHGSCIRTPLRQHTTDCTIPRVSDQTSAAVMPGCLTTRQTKQVPSSLYGVRRSRQPSTSAWAAASQTKRDLSTSACGVRISRQPSTSACGAADQKRDLNISLRRPKIKAAINICLLPQKATALCHPTSGETAGAPICRGSSSAVKTGDPPSEINPWKTPSGTKPVIGSEMWRLLLSAHGEGEVMSCGYFTIGTGNIASYMRRSATQKLRGKNPLWGRTGPCNRIFLVPAEPSTRTTFTCPPFPTYKTPVCSVWIHQSAAHSPSLYTEVSQQNGPADTGGRGTATINVKADRERQLPCPWRLLQLKRGS